MLFRVWTRVQVIRSVENARIPEAKMNFPFLPARSCLPFDEPLLAFYWQG